MILAPALGCWGAAITDGTEPAAAADELPSITVTAQKRTENIKDIPSSISAIGGAEVAEHHIVDYDDISRSVPGVSFQAGAGPGLENIEIRGVSSTSGSATVGLYMDEVSVTVKNTFDGAVQPKLFDLDRIEVLRGPQGTLYGASSMGGTIRFITKQPDLSSVSASASSELSFTKHGGFNHEEYGILNIPIISGVFALRIGLDISDESGYVNHYAPTPNGAAPDGSLLTLATDDSTGMLARRGVNDIRTTAFRVSGKYLGSSDWSITPAFLYQRTSTGDSGIFYPSIGLYAQDKRVAEPGKDVLTIPSVTVVKGWSWGELTSVTSHFHRAFRHTTDGTYYNSNVFANAVVIPTIPQTPVTTYQTASVLGFLPSPVFLDTKTDQYAEELRIASKSGAIANLPTTWTAGVYFSYQTQGHTDDEFIPGLQAGFQQIYGYGLGSNASALGPTNYPGVSYANDQISVDALSLTERQIAPFGELGVSVTPQLKATLGLRYVSAKSTFHYTSSGYYAYGLPNPYGDHEKFNATTPKFAVSYALNDNSNLYASIAKGFRLGGPTGPDPAIGPGGICNQDYANLGLPGAPLRYQSDSLWSYEIGSKGRYFDNRLTLNAAVYAINWKNIQQTVNLPVCGFFYTTNAGNAESYGSEVELRALVTSSLVLGLNAGTTHAYITKTAEAGIFQVGEDILNVPAFTVTPSVDYDIPVGEQMSAFFRADFPYTGRSHAYYNSSTVTNHWSPSYGILNLNFGITYNKVSVALFAKNALDSQKIIQYPSVNTVQEGYSVRPLTVGITAQMKL